MALGSAGLSFWSPHGTGQKAREPNPSLETRTAAARGRLLLPALAGGGTWPPTPCGSGASPKAPLHSPPSLRLSDLFGWTSTSFPDSLT